MIPRTDEGRKVAAAVHAASWDEDEDSHKWFELGGSIQTCVVSFAPGPPKERERFLRDCLEVS